MSYALVIFVRTSGASCQLRHDSGVVVMGVPGLHWSGRPGFVFALPTGLTNGIGAELLISAPAKNLRRQRGIVLLNDGVMPWPLSAQDQALMTVDDYAELDDTVVCPVVPEPGPGPGPGPQTPQQIIQATYDTGLYHLTTKEGCGQFTEASCTACHDQDSKGWGFIRKHPGQNQYHGHAVDAMMLLQPTRTTSAGIYDIIYSSESPEAKPTFNLVGPADPSLWYYPA